MPLPDFIPGDEGLHPFHTSALKPLKGCSHATPSMFCQLARRSRLTQSNTLICQTKVNNSYITSVVTHQ